MVHGPRPGSREQAVDGISARGRIQRYGGDGSFAVDPAQLGPTHGGKPLPQALLAKMEAAFGTDFSAVRVHVGPQAARIGALAFTTGNDLYFAHGQYQPDNVRGQQLIGHELAHVVQQRQGRVRSPGNGLFVVHDHTLEAEADRLGMKAAAHRPVVQPKLFRGGAARQVQPRHASLALQKKCTALGSAVQRSQAAPTRVSTRVKHVPSSQLLDDARLSWAKQIEAGTLDTSLVFASQGGHTCLARGRTKKGKYAGEFGAKHAEMDLITKIYKAEGSLNGIKSIEIEKQPCPRCAVVLNVLGLSGLVTYMETGCKDYPTWTYPDLGTMSPMTMIGLGEDGYSSDNIQDLTKDFYATKFWK